MTIELTDRERDVLRGNGDYHAFLERKAQLYGNHGFKAEFIPDYLFDFQKALVEWAVQKGRGAIFADCGLGKTPMQLVWAENIVRHTSGKVMILTPLAVSAQTLREAEKFGIEATRSSKGQAHRITITNYEKLHYFDANDFVGCVCDESSILKNFDGARRGQITAFMRKMRYRLLCTATAAPNDYHELGTSSEALGYLGYMDMLNRFFKNDQNNSSNKRLYGKKTVWRFKGHAEEPFWRWVCSWARAARKPSDIGFEDGPFILPELIENVRLIEARTKRPGTLFELPATNFFEEREERRRTITERCEKAAELVDHDRPSLMWCHLNDEGDLLEKLVPDAVQVAGSDSDEAKEEKLLAFANQEARVLVTKPKIGAWGLNFQHCSHISFFPSHSYEQLYQGVRRCWRFGQKNPVVVEMVTTPGQRNILANLQRKAKAADEMFERLVLHMNEALEIERFTEFAKQEEVPSWL